MAVAVVMPVTVTGTSESVWLPLPSSPTPLKPQHCTVPPVRSAHEKEPPAETAVAVVARPVTVTGSAESASLLLPSWPLAFNPQHCTVPSTSRAHEW